MSFKNAVRREIPNLSNQVEKEGWRQDLFEILWEGEISPNNLQMELVTPVGSSLKRTTESEQYIEDRWQQRLSGGFKAWPNDTQPTRYHYAGMRNEGGVLTVAADPCVSYRDFKGAYSEEFIKRFGKNALPNPLSTTSLIFCKNKKGEDHIIVGLRSEKTDNKAGGYHVSAGGFLEIGKDTDITAAALREVEEEIGIKPHECTEVACRGVVYSDFQTAAVYRVSTNVALEDVVARKNEKVEEAEQSLIFVPAKRIKLQQLMLGPMHAGIATGIAGLVLLGKEIASQEGLDGNRWRKEMYNALAWRTHDIKSKPQEELQSLESRDRKRLVARVKNTTLKDAGAASFVIEDENV